MSEKSIKVTISDPDTEEELDSAILADGHVLICHGTAYEHSVVAHANGTHVVTVKGVK